MGRDLGHEALEIDAAAGVAREELDVPSMRRGAMHRRCPIAGGDARHRRVGVEGIEDTPLYDWRRARGRTIRRGVVWVPVPDGHQSTGVALNFNGMASCCWTPGSARCPGTQQHRRHAAGEMESGARMVTLLPR